MSKKLLSTLIASLFVAGPALAQSDDDPMRVQGTATLGGHLQQHQRQDSTSSRNLYQDLSNGALSNVGIRGRNSTTWFHGLRRELRPHRPVHVPARRHVRHLQGGRIPQRHAAHVLVERASRRTTAAAATLLTATFPLGSATSTPPGTGTRSTWGTSAGRRRLFEWQKNSPWYFRVDGNQVTFNGTKVGSAANGTSPGNGYVDLAFPVEYKTSNWGVEGGYQTGKATLLRCAGTTASSTTRTRRSSGPTRSSAATRSTRIVPAAGQHVQQVHADRQLPRPAVEVGDLRALHVREDHERRQPRAVRAERQQRLQLRRCPDQGNFNGENVNQSFALAWTAVPVTSVDTRVYYYWTKLQNHSDEIQYGNAPTNPLAERIRLRQLHAGWRSAIADRRQLRNDLYNYTKNDVGFDVWWRFMRGSRLGFGYDYNNLDQTRVDYDKSHVSKLWVEYKNTMFDTWSGRLKYQYLKRDSTLNYSNAGLSPNDPNYLLPYTSAFDLQSGTTNLRSS
jgi:hypothetical protein